MNILKQNKGMSFLEILCCLSILAVFTAVSVPNFCAYLSRSRLKAAGRSLACLFQKTRITAINTSRYTGILFERTEMGGLTYTIYGDGDGDGIRTADIRDNVDFVLEKKRRLPMEGVELGITDGDISDVPTSGGKIGNPGRPLRFGRSQILSFSPMGRSSSGSVYLKSGEKYMVTIKVYGLSAKIRFWEYLPAEEEWK